MIKIAVQESILELGVDLRRSRARDAVRCPAIVILCLLGLDCGLVRAQSSCAAAAEVEVMVPGTQAMQPASELRTRVLELLADRDRLTGARDRSLRTCVVAEIARRLGDLQAESYYQESVTLDPSNSEAHLLFGNFYLSYRGPEQPLVGAAEKEYFAGLLGADEAVANQIRRSLIALYERDGLSLTGRIDNGPPRLFFSTQNTGVRSPDDPGSVDGISLRASAASLAQSNERLGRPLTTSELEALIRNDWRTQTLQRLRARHGSTAVDAYFEGHTAQGSQPVNFRELETAVDASVAYGGVGVEQVMNLYPAFDLMVRGDVKWGSRRGLVEFDPNADESTRSLVARAVASRFIGRDKITLEVNAAHDTITPHVANPDERGVDVFGVTARYQIFRPLLGSRPYERPIASRGSEIFVGTTKRTEIFGAVGVDRSDLFAGASLKGIPGGGEHSFDITVQPTLFKFERRARTAEDAVPDPLANEQVETFVTVLYRLIDHENERSIDSLPPVVFVNLVGLFSVGEARTGPTQFDHARAGGQLDAKLVGRQHGGVTWLLSGRYELQDFSTLGRKEHVFGVSVSMGF